METQDYSWRAIFALIVLTLLLVGTIIYITDKMYADKEPCKIRFSCTNTLEDKTCKYNVGNVTMVLTQFSDICMKE